MVRSASIRNKVYKFVHYHNVFIKTNLINRNFQSEWLWIEPDGTITMRGQERRGYAWDGCSPKVNLLHFTFGTPDGKFDYVTEKPMTYYASMIHDVIYQYKKEVPISRLEADFLFAKMLRQAGFMWWWLYGIAVILGGAFYGQWGREQSDLLRKIKIEKHSWLEKDYEAMAREHLSTLLKKRVESGK